MMVGLLLSVTIIILLLCKYSLPSKNVWKMGNDLPGPKAYPFIGNVLLIMNSNSFINAFNELLDKYGNVVRLWMGKKLWVSISNPEDIKIFLADKQNYLTKSEWYHLLYPWLGNGLVICNGTEWSVHRKLLTPAFHFHILDEAMNIIVDNTTYLIHSLSILSPNLEIDVRDYMEKCILDIIGEIAMGYKFNIQKSNDLTYLNAIKDLTTGVVKRVQCPWLWSNMIYPLTNSGRKFHRAAMITRNIVQKLIDEKKNELNNRTCKINNEVDQGEERKTSGVFLELLLTNRNFTDKEIVDEVQTFLFAGHDTITTSLTFCLYALAQHQDIQDKVASETSCVISKNRKLTINSLTELKYTENVIKEAMRIYTPVPHISREVNIDTPLSSGHVIPAGSLVHLNLIHMHSRPDLFPNPKEFNPDRFEKSNIRHPYSFIPFSAGIKNCIGQRFAMLEMKIVLAFLLKHYKFTPSSKIKILDSALVLTSHEEIKLKISKRESNST